MADKIKNVTITENTQAQINALKIAYKHKHKRNITKIDIVAKLVSNAKLKDIE